MRLSPCIPTLLALAAALPAQAIEDPGPFPGGIRSVQFVDQQFGQGQISGRVYYPATAGGWNQPPDSANGPYPMLVFQHGWLGSPDNYDDLCTHIASWGFLVVATGTETGLFPDHDAYARDAQAFLHWADNQSATAGSWLEGMAAGTPWAAAGHSMGGGNLARIIGLEPRVETIIGLQSAGATGALETTNMRNYTGSHWQIAGSVDRIVPPSTVRTWYVNADSAPRNLYYEVIGMGHTGCTDTPPNFEQMPGAEQHRLHRRLVTGLLRAEMKGEEDLFVDLLGDGIAQEDVVYAAECADPPFWTTTDVLPGSITVGIVGAGGITAQLAGAPNPGSTNTIYGLLELELASAVVFHDAPLGSAGVVEVDVPIQAAWSGSTLYFQGLVLGASGGQFSRSVAIPIP